jgi:hypothetical protein
MRRFVTVILAMIRRIGDWDFGVWRLVSLAGSGWRLGDPIKVDGQSSSSPGSGRLGDRVDRCATIAYVAKWAYESRDPAGPEMGVLLPGLSVARSLREHDAL